MLRFQSICLGAMVAAFAAGAYGDSIYSDGTFNNADWTLTTEQVGTGGSTSASQQLTGGNPGPWRQVMISVNGAGSTASFALSFNEKISAVYNPASQGAISSVDYSEDSILTNGFGDGQFGGLALMQGGTIYYHFGFKANVFAWTHNTETAGTSASFVTAAYYQSGGATINHPDFSAAGAPITFGFGRVDSQAPFGVGYSITAGIDNWMVDVHSAVAPAAPLPASAWGGLVLLGGLGLMSACKGLQPLY